MNLGVRLRASISFICCLVALWLVVHAVPTVHAQDGASSRPPPSAAGRRFPRLQPTAARVQPQPQEADSERAPSDEPPALPAFPYAGDNNWAPSYERVALDGRHDGRRHPALLFAGVMTCLTSLLATELFVTLSLIPYDSDDGCSSDCKADKRATYPLVGPFMALATSGPHKHDEVYTWTGLSQAFGFVATVWGAIIFAQDPNKPDPTRLTFAAMPTRDGAEMALRFRL